MKVLAIGEGYTSACVDPQLTDKAIFLLFVMHAYIMYHFQRSYKLRTALN